MNLEINPYQPVEGKVFTGEYILDVTPELFRGQAFVDGKMTLAFISCIFTGSLEIRNSVAIEFKDISIHFYGCYINGIDVDQIVSGNISIHFGSSIISGRIKSNNLTNVSCNNTLPSRALFLIDVQSVHISFSEENIFFEDWKKIWPLTQVNTISALLKIDRSFHLHQIDKITYETRERRPDLKSGIRRLKYPFIDSHLGYYPSQEEKDSLNISLIIHYKRSSNECWTKIHSSKLSSLQLEGYSSGPIAVENTKIRLWYLANFSAGDDISFYNIQPPSNSEDQSIIEFHKCKLDGTWFDNVDLRKYKLVSFYRTKFAKANFTSCTFPDNYTSFENFRNLENAHYPDEKSENYYKDQYEMFLQLKTSLDSSGNYYEAQRLQAIAHDSLRRVKTVRRSDKFVLWINSLSNNHGLSVKRPFAGFLISSIILYILYLWSLGRMFNENGIDADLFGYYFAFIDITHRADFLVKKSEFNSWSMLIDFAGKLLVGFFVYQFVAAFRKYGKK